MSKTKKVRTPELDKVPMIEITIKAPQGWGKTWLAEHIAREVSALKGGAVLVHDGESTVSHGEYTGRGDIVGHVFIVQTE